MGRQTATVEWVVAENDAEWEQICAPSTPEMRPGVAAASPDRRDTQRILAGVALVLLLLAGAGAWGGRAIEAEPLAEEAHATAGRELPVVAQRDGRLTISKATGEDGADWWHQLAREYDGLLAATQTAAPDEHLDAALRNVEFHGDQALATVVMYRGDGSPAYRQTRFYQRTSTRWQGIAPDASLWGPERSLETPSFIFHFRQRDAAAVIAVAPQVETLYQTMRHNFGLPLSPPAEKLVIEVSVTQTPGHSSSWFGAASPMVVTSPARYRAPVGLADAELLAQAIILPLLEHVIAKAARHHAISPARSLLLRGLRLWQVWELGLPLSAWRDDITQWVYRDRPTHTPQLPGRYSELCAAHQLWLPSPMQIYIPLWCDDPAREAAHMTQWYSREPPIRLAQLALPDELLASAGGPDWADYAGQSIALYSGQTIALVTLIDYAVAAYGRERLPVLMASLGQHESWETLLPAVYGVSAADFEAGWQADLAARYGISVNGKARSNGKELPMHCSST